MHSSELQDESFDVEEVTQCRSDALHLGDGLGGLDEQRVDAGVAGHLRPLDGVVEADRVVDPERRGELYPLYHQLRRLAPVHRNRPSVLHGAWSFTRFADADQLIDDPQIGAVVIATPPSSHARYAARALEAGKPVLLEKPMTGTLAEARLLADLAARNHLREPYALRRNQRLRLPSAAIVTVIAFAGAVVSKPMPKKTTCLSGLACARRTASSGE